ncbi:MAG: hypothetical protein DME64_10485 [Verrucomicrobia bacterium]|nr:MAG: hypothetical protein DME64_10485 [Verrucomicrobiota bacterium]
MPASNIGSVDVIDEKTDAVSQIGGFPTGEIERRGRKITVGPTAASIGDEVVYIGNRGNGTLCVVDAKTLTRGECVPVSADRTVTPDGVVYVAATREVWVTLRVKAGDNAPAKSLEVFDASDPHHLKPKTKIPLDGLAEGYAVDNQRGLFYTNIEDTGSTVAIDVRTHKIVFPRRSLLGQKRNERTEFPASAESVTISRSSSAAAGHKVARVGNNRIGQNSRLNQLCSRQPATIANCSECRI